MLCNVDAKALDWLTALYLSQDKVGCNEWREEIDQHTLNQEAFGLPSRLIAKKFLFRCIFLGQAHTYANDPEFFDVSSNPKYWQEVIDRFFEKYSGFRKWVDATIRQAVNTGQTSIPTGRIFVYERKPNRHGEMVWPETEIANHPIN